MTTEFACERFASVEEMLLAPCACEWDEHDDADLLEAVLDQASDILTLISGFRVHGRCVVTVRPVGDSFCLPYRDDVGGGISGSPYLDTAVKLRGPNTEVISVYVDGQLVPVSSYGLLNDCYLQRLDGESWPSTQDLTLPDTAVGTWSITYRFGRRPDFITKEASIELACELAAAYAGRSNSLPSGVTSANIQGVSVQLQDRADALREGANESIPAVSRFLGAYAPEGSRRNGVWSPELAGNWDLVQVEGPSGS